MTDMQGDHRDGPWSWWYRFVAIYLGVVFVLIGTALIFGPPRWTGGNSLQILHAHLSIPWPAWGGLFILVGLGVFPRRTRLAAYCVGAVLAVFFTAMAILFSVFSGTITNPIAIGLATLSVPMLLAGIRYAVLVDGERR